MGPGLGSAGLLHEVIFLVGPEGRVGDTTEPRPQRGYQEEAMRSLVHKHLVSAGAWGVTRCVTMLRRTAG